MVEKIYGCYGIVKLKGLTAEESFKRYGILYRITNLTKTNSNMGDTMDIPGKSLDKEVKMDFEKIEGKTALTDIYFTKGFVSF